MKYVSLLSDLEITEINGSPLLNDGKPITLKHAEFLLGRLADSEFSSDIDSIAIGLVIREKLLPLLKKPAKYLALEDAHWQKLCNSCRAPKANGGNGYNPQLAHNFHDAIQAVLQASDKDPATKKAVER